MIYCIPSKAINKIINPVNVSVSKIGTSPHGCPGDIQIKQKGNKYIDSHVPKMLNTYNNAGRELSYFLRCVVHVRLDMVLCG